MRTELFAIIAVAAFALGNVAHSQAPGGPQTAAQRLRTIKAKNQELIDRQIETLRKLDELQLQAQQLKFLGKRS